MRFPLTQQLLEEAKAFELRAACRDCFFWNARDNECWHGWPDEGQRQWPLGNAASAPGEDGQPSIAAGSEVAFCKEFELR
jgi:hypothetical protein